jgi:hypothetical protein
VVVSVRRPQPEREHCARGDTLFERTDGAAFRAIRPIGAGMALDVPSAAGGMMRYSTGAASVQRVTADLDVAYIPTTILSWLPRGASAAARGEMVRQRVSRRRQSGPPEW